ncbi:MAG: caspase family protein [Alphaproteobacteria bacterium]
MRAIACLLLTLLLGGAAAAASAAENRDGIAVLIGNRDYQGRVPDVDYAHNDADAMRRYVLDVLGFQDGNLIDLRDATKAHMEAAFGNQNSHRGKLFNWVREGRSDVVVYYSGHGMAGVEDQRGYLLPVDADAETPELNGYAIDTLYANLAKLPARSVTVFIDACFTGDSPKGSLVKSASPVHVRAKPAKVSKGLTVLTAARADQLASWDDEARHGLFTRHLLDALYGAADAGVGGDKDGKVTLAEVSTYLDEEMTYAARRQFGRTQNATVTGDPGLLLVAAVPDGGRPALPAAKPAEPDPKPRTAMVRPTPTPAPARPAAPALRPMDEMFVAVKNANVRDRPNVAGARVGAVPAGQQVQVTGSTGADGWFRVRLGDGTVGYVFSDLLLPAGAGVVAPRRANQPTAPNAAASQLLAQGNALVQAGNLPAAEQVFRNLVGSFPNSPEASDAAYQLGRSILYQGNLDGAVTVLEQAYARFPEHPLATTAMLEVGQAAMNVANYGLACLALVEFVDVYEGGDFNLLARVQDTVDQLGCE